MTASPLDFYFQNMYNAVITHPIYTSEKTIRGHLS